MPRYLHVATDPSGTALWLLHDHLSPCALRCRFCPTSLVPVPPRLTDPGVRAAILAEIDALLVAPPRRVVLASADILEYPDLDAILDRLTGIPVTLVSPGWRLADPAFADAIAARGVTVDLTLLSDVPATYARITGVADAHRRTLAALDAVRARGISLRMSVTVNRDNAPELADTLLTIHHRYAMPAVTVRWFFPDVPDAAPDWYDQMPDPRWLREALAALDTGPSATLPTLELRNVPLCQVDLRGLRRLQVRVPPHTAEQNMYKADGWPPCATCAAADRCVRLDPRAIRQLELLPPEPAVIAAAIAASAPPKGPPPGTGKLPGEGRPRGEGTPPGQGRPKGAGIPKALGRRPGSDDGPPGSDPS